MSLVDSIQHLVSPSCGGDDGVGIGLPSRAIRWQALRRSGGDARPKQQGGDRLSRPTEAHSGLIHAALAEVADITLPELKARLALPGRVLRSRGPSDERSRQASMATMQRGWLARKVSTSARAGASCGT